MIRTPSLRPQKQDLRTTTLNIVQKNKFEDNILKQRANWLQRLEGDILKQSQDTKQRLIDIRLKINNRIKQISECNTDLHNVSSEIAKSISEYPTDSFKFNISYRGHCQNAIDILKEQISKKRVLLEEKWKLVKSVTEKVVSAENKCHSTQHELKEQIFKLEKDIRSKEDEINEASLYNTKLQTSIETQNELLSTLSNEIASGTSEINHALTQEESLQRRSMEVMQEFNIFKEKRIQISEILLNLRVCFDSFQKNEEISHKKLEEVFLQMEAKSFHASLREVLNNLKEWFEKLKHVKSEVEMGGEERKSLLHKISEVNKYLENENIQLKQLKEENSNIRIEIENILSKEAMLKSNVASLQNSYDKQIAEKKSLNSEITLLSSKDSTQFKNSELEFSIDTENQKEKRLKSELTKISLDIENYEEKFDNIIQESQKCQENLESTLQNCKKLKTELGKLKLDRETAINSRKTLEKKNEDIAKLLLDKEIEKSQEKNKKMMDDQYQTLQQESKKRIEELGQSFRKEIERVRLLMKKQHDKSIENLHKNDEMRKKILGEEVRRNVSTLQHQLEELEKQMHKTAMQQVSEEDDVEFSKVETPKKLRNETQASRNRGTSLNRLPKDNSTFSPSHEVNEEYIYHDFESSVSGYSKTKTPGMMKKLSRNETSKKKHSKNPKKQGNSKKTKGRKNTCKDVFEFWDDFDF